MATPRPATVVALEGPSAAGKTTLSRALAQAVNAVYMDEAYYRLEPRPSLELAGPDELFDVETRLLDEEARRFTEASTLLREGKTVVADTSFLSPITYTFGLAYLRLVPPELFHRLLRRARGLAAEGSWGLPEHVVYLSAGLDLTRRRAAEAPAKHPPQLRARHSAVARIERRLWLGPIRESMPGRVHVLTAATPLNRLIEQVDRRVRTRPPTVGGRSVEAERLLGLLAKGMA
ncbi:MAG: AAA family ATPase [Thermoplasmata archaeon]|nr:AAA family ATPase [Thermoplasmata archaeon]